jgi:hypothetical protein
VTRFLPALLLLGILAVPVSAAEPVPCQLGGPAGTASVLRVDVPHGSRSLALRITSPAPPPTVTSRTSWHLATQVAVLRADSGALVATRVVQTGSNPRALAVTGSGHATRVDVPGPGFPFTHVGASVPPYLGPGRYLLVAYGTDGSAALPNPGWAAEASFGTAVTCAPLHVATRLVDRDQTTFTGGTQVSPLTGSGTAATWRLKERYVVGFADAATQGVGEATLRGSFPRGRTVSVHNGLAAFSAGSGTYRFAANWSGSFPLVLVCSLAFTP